jgi:exodeoxyribonuclease V alpha subunit
VHRLLGWSAGSFRYHRGNPLPLDMLVVDEASMLDLELATRLLDALPEHASLVLLGDRNQLASVEAGAVLANLCREDVVNSFSPGFAAAAIEAGAPGLPVTDRPRLLTDHVVELKKSWRFGPDSGIAALSTLIRDGMPQAAEDLLKEGRADLEMRPCTGQADLTATLAPLLRESFKDLGKTTDPKLAFEIFGALRLLSPVRKGPYGTESLNNLAREILHRSTGNDWYPGRPVMILENDYNLASSTATWASPCQRAGSCGSFFPAPRASILLAVPPAPL